MSASDAGRVADSSRLAVGMQGHYAGAVTRLAAYAVDQFAVATAFTLLIAFVRFAAELVLRRPVEWTAPTVLLAGGYAVWWFVYFAYPWAVSGKTLGMSLLGIRVTSRDGAPLTGRRACIRALTLPLGFVTFGLAFAGIVVGRERRGLHDHLAGTAVVYDWDARTAHLRFLAASSGAPRPGPGRATDG